MTKMKVISIRASEDEYRQIKSEAQKLYGRGGLSGWILEAALMRLDVIRLYEQKKPTIRELREIMRWDAPRIFGEQPSPSDLPNSLYPDGVETSDEDLLASLTLAIASYVEEEPSPPDELAARREKMRRLAEDNKDTP